MNKNLSLADIIEKEEKSGLDFVTLMQKLFKEDARQKNYHFESNAPFRNIQIDGIVKNGFPGVNGKVIFQFRKLNWSRSGSTDTQLNELLSQIVNSKIPFNQYILVTPFELTSQQKLLFYNLRIDKGMNLVHFGSEEIEKMLDQYPALKKYLFRESQQDTQWNFKEFKSKYKEAIENKVKYLNFAGLPTAQYQKPGLLKPVSLIDIFIKPNFKKKEHEKNEYSLSQILRNKNKSSRFLVLAGPGSGKSTLASYLVLDICQKDNSLTNNELEDKVPFFIPLCDFAWTQEKLHRKLDFVEYLKHDAENRLLKNELKNQNLHCSIDRDFFIAMLELGMAVVIFDGLDEIPKERWRGEIVDKIESFLYRYSENPVWVMSRLFGYKTSNRNLNSLIFKEYYLQPVSAEQTDHFIDNWYFIQIPEVDKLDYRNSKIQALKKATEASEHLGWFKQNPLYLTMMVILNQFGGGVPKNKALLYAKYLELILWTWPNRKYSTLSEGNPLENRGINYQEQLRLLCVISAHIKGMQEDKLVSDDQEIHQSNTLSKSEIEHILYLERLDNIRSNGKTAHEDANVFINYMLDRTGFWLEQEEGPNGIRAISFLHSSFIDYLYAYHVTRDMNKTDMEHIDFLLKFLGVPEWEEFILFAVLQYSNLKLAEFFDLFSKRLFDHLSINDIPYAWVTSGRFIRDNIKFDDNTISGIINKLIKLWLKNINHSNWDKEDKNIFGTVLAEIAKYSFQGKLFLKKGMEKIIVNNPPIDAFAALSFIKRYYSLESNILSLLENYKYKENLLPYLPIYRDDTLMSTYINENLKERHWTIYYNSTRQQILDNLDRIAKRKVNDFELRGYVLSSWSKILKAFNDRQSFLKKNKSLLGNTDLGASDFRFITFGSVYDLENTIHHPLLIFRRFISKSFNLSFECIKDNFFISLDRKREISVNSNTIAYISNWSINLLIQIFSVFKRFLPAAVSFSDDEKQHIKRDSISFGNKFSQDVVRYSNDFFCDDLYLCFNKETISPQPPNFLIMNFRKYLGQYFKLEFDRILNHQEFNQSFRRYWNRNIGKRFSRYFTKNLSWTLNEEVTQNFLTYLLNDKACAAKDFKEYKQLYRNLDLKALISKYSLQHLKKDKDLLEKKDYDLIYKFIVDEFNQERPQFIDSFYIHFYEFLFNERFSLSFQSQDCSKQLSFLKNIMQLPELYLSINSPFMIPFIFNFIFNVDLNHYMIKLLSNLNTKFFLESIPDTSTILEAVNDYYYENPFITYFIAYAWDVFCKQFNCNYIENDNLAPLTLAAIIVDAAKVSLTTERLFNGTEWNKVLIKAGQSKNEFVKISLTLYNLCNFADSIIETDNLEKLLYKLKLESPEYYRLIGLDEKFANVNNNEGE